MDPVSARFFVRVRRQQHRCSRPRARSCAVGAIVEHVSRHATWSASRRLGPTLVASKGGCKRLPFHFFLWTITMPSSSNKSLSARFALPSRNPRSVNQPSMACHSSLLAGGARRSVQGTIHDMPFSIPAIHAMPLIPAGRRRAELRPRSCLHRAVQRRAEDHSRRPPSIRPSNGQAGRRPA